jgi:DNA-binding beta-propeller fold protein YncE
MTKSTPWIRRMAVLAFVLAGAAQADASTSGFIPAEGRVDIAFDGTNQVLYISGGPQVRRFDFNTKSFLPPLALGGATMGMDVSADGKRLAIANASRDANENFVDIVTLRTGKVRRVPFPLAFSEGGTHAVAYDADGKLLVTSRFEGSGWTPLRRFDPVTGLSHQLAELSAPAMVSPSANHRYVAVAEGNVSSGPYGRYMTGDTAYRSLQSTSWSLFEIAIAPNGSQSAVPTYGGTFIDDAKKSFPAVGTYAGQTPIGAAYAPTGDVVYFPFAQSNFVAEYDRRTMTERRRFTVPGQFDWTGNGAFVEGRTKVSPDGRLLFVTLDDGVFYQELAATN